MTQEGPGANLRVRWALRLYLATVAIFLLAVLVGLATMALSSDGFVRGVTVTGAGGILASLTLLLKGPISRFYDDAVRENRYEHYMISREVKEERLRRTWEELSPVQQKLEFQFWLEQRKDERRAFESLEGGTSSSAKRSRASVPIGRDHKETSVSQDAKAVESESR